MKPSKRTQRILSKLTSIQEVTEYYMGDHFKADFLEIRKLIHELSVDKKEDHKRFARKLKGIWKREND